MYKLKDLVEVSSSLHLNINGAYVPARPMRMSGIAGWKHRIKAAWAVLTDKADAVVWPNNQ